MTYTVRIRAEAKRDLNQLPEKVRAAVLQFVYGPLAENPQRLGKALRFELTGLHSARRGEYRVLYEISDEEVVVEAVGHRSGIYHR